MLAYSQQQSHHLHLLAPAPTHPGAYDDASSSSTTSSSPPPVGAKRYRSAPAKTFQCSGYGDCAMVFSRSEHLARHIRKHTGERPFQCHCGKQFSRLDNLRQHAQTVHSTPEEKPLNERMMRALAGINASMLAGVRGRRRYQHSTDASPMLYSPGYSPSSSGSPGLSSASSSSSSDAYEYADYAEYEQGQGHAAYAAYVAGAYPSGSHSLPASPSYPSFPVGVQSQGPYASPPPPTYHHSPPPTFSHPRHAHAHSYPYPQTAPILQEADDYLAAGMLAASVKEEQVDVDLSNLTSMGTGSPELEEFYRAVCAPPPTLLASPPMSSSSPSSLASSSPSPPPFYASPDLTPREMSNAEYYRAVEAQQQQQYYAQTGYAYA